MRFHIFVTEIHFYSNNKELLHLIISVSVNYFGTFFYFSLNYQFKNLNDLSRDIKSEIYVPYSPENNAALYENFLNRNSPNT